MNGSASPRRLSVYPFIVAVLGLSLSGLLSPWIYFFILFNALKNLYARSIGT